MEKEMEKQLEWLEAQKVEISVDLFVAAKQHLQFLEAVDRKRWLYEGPTLERAIYRYNACWLPLLAKHSESSVSEGPLVPPLDCEWVWHCHRLNPVRYMSDCKELYGRVLDNSAVVSSINGNSKLQTEAIWKKMYPMEPYDLDLDQAISEPKDISSLEKCTTYDLVSAVKRQTPFYYKLVSKARVEDDIFLQEAVGRYKAFLYLIKINKEKSIESFCVPTYDIDLIWHTHQLNPSSYFKDMKKILGYVLQHDDTDSDRSQGSKHGTGSYETSAHQWEETFGRKYLKAGSMNGGNTPKPAAASPYLQLSAEDKAMMDDAPVCYAMMDDAPVCYAFMVAEVHTRGGDRARCLSDCIPAEIKASDGGIGKCGNMVEGGRGGCGSNYESSPPAKAPSNAVAA